MCLYCEAYIFKSCRYFLHKKDNLDLGVLVYVAMLSLRYIQQVKIL